jgi:hypothetical protein
MSDSDKCENVAPPCAGIIVDMKELKRLHDIEAEHAKLVGLVEKQRFLNVVEGKIVIRFDCDCDGKWRIVTGDEAEPKFDTAIDAIRAALKKRRMSGRTTLTVPLQ